MLPSPFPMKHTDGKVVVDEKCRCGALRTEHLHRVAFGHGGCTWTGCAQFTWAGSVYGTTNVQPKKGE